MSWMARCRDRLKSGGSDVKLSFVAPSHVGALVRLETLIDRPAREPEFVSDRSRTDVTDPRREVRANVLPMLVSVFELRDPLRESDLLGRRELAQRTWHDPIVAGGSLEHFRRTLALARQRQ
jgi:hypothetical protein